MPHNGARVQLEETDAEASNIRCDRGWSTDLPMDLTTKKKTGVMRS